MRRVMVCLAIGMLTVAAYAQWITNDEVPAYHATAPAPGTKLPPLLSGTQLSGPLFQYPWHVLFPASQISPMPSPARAVPASGSTIRTSTPSSG